VGAREGVQTGYHLRPDPGLGTAGRTDNFDGGVEEAVVNPRPIVSHPENQIHQANHQ